MFRGRKNNISIEVTFQMTPMIDMTFLLLIFFMVTTRLTEESRKREIRLPSAMSAVVPDNLKDRDTISIDGVGVYFVGDQQHSREQMAAYLKKRCLKPWAGQMDMTLLARFFWEKAWDMAA